MYDHNDYLDAGRVCASIRICDLKAGDVVWAPDPDPFNPWREMVEIVAVGPDAETFARAALKLPFLDRIVLRAPNSVNLSASHPAQEKLRAIDGSAAFVCVGETCSLPVSEPAAIAPAVAAMRNA